MDRYLAVRLSDTEGDAVMLEESLSVVRHGVSSGRPVKYYPVFLDAKGKPFLGDQLTPKDFK